MSLSSSSPVSPDPRTVNARMFALLAVCRFPPAVDPGRAHQRRANTITANKINPWRSISVGRCGNFSCPKRNKRTGVRVNWGEMGSTSSDYFLTRSSVVRSAGTVGVVVWK